MVEKHVELGGVMIFRQRASSHWLQFNGLDEYALRRSCNKKASRIERPVLALRSGLPAKVELLVFQHLSVLVCRLMVAFLRRI